MECAVKGDQFVSLGVKFHQLDGGFDGLGAGVAEVNALGFLAWRDGRELFGKFNHAGVVEISAGHVNQLAGLLLDGGYDFGMAMAGSDYGDACGEIEEDVAVNIFDCGAAADFRDERVVARVGRRDYVMVALDEFLGFGAGQFGDEVRQLRINFAVRHMHYILQKRILKSARRPVPAGGKLKTKVGGAYLINAVEIRALVRGLAMQREIEFCGDAHLYFQRTVPSRVSSTMIPEFRSSWRISSERLKSRRFLAALRSAMSWSIFSGVRRGGPEPKPSSRSFSSSSSARTARIASNFFHGGKDDGRVLLQEFAAIHSGVHIAHQIENGGERECGVQIVSEAGIEIG